MLAAVHTLAPAQVYIAQLKAGFEDRLRFAVGRRDVAQPCRFGVHREAHSL